MLLYIYYELLPLQSLRRTTLKVRMAMSLSSICEHSLTLKCMSFYLKNLTVACVNTQVHIMRHCA